MDKNKRLLRTGVIGTLIVALCCFTPLLVILLAAVGLSAFTGHLDVVLFPALAFFIGLTGYAFYRKKSQRNPVCCNTDRHGGETNE
ncbi:mercury resistance system transport protein MerF [uncultured Paraglaciecola sp.]|uniref:mercury resistance system transport protein MerF n=1 Tax=uncultured Paraglaciecola sp. TaxID=1765024 RepID=UPI002604AFFD|nr:mercury resistance system transport protein MerF [uncultured Paraglaciecola sp.]